MSDAALIQAVIPRDRVKRLARLMDAPVETARHWLYRRLPAGRRAELGRRLLAEFERQEAERTRIRGQLLAMMGER